MAAGRDDDTPPGRAGRYRQRGGVHVDQVTPLPPPPVQVRPETPLPWTRVPEAIPEAVELERTDITGRVMLAVAGSQKVDRSEIRWLLGLAVTAILAGIVWWADVREGLRNRPTRDELRQELRPLQDQVRGIERLLDQRLPRSP